MIKSMRTTLMSRTFGIFLSLLLLCSCATTPEPSAIIPASELPADVTINKDAGRGNKLIVTLRLESGEELPFFVDTGAGGTVFDASLEPGLGKPLGTWTVQRWGVKEKKSVYATPKLYLGSTLLTTGSRVLAFDFSGMSFHTGKPIMGVLGMDVLEHYCIQLDFSAGKLRFLDDEHADKKGWGRAFPIVALNSNDARPSIGENLFGAQGPHSLIDSGYDTDGWLMPRFYQQWTNQAARPVKGKARSPKGMFGGESYPQISMRVENVESDGIGLPFLARHLVTLDFPKHTMYLKRTSIGPLPDGGVAAVLNFLKGLKEKGQLPGWSTDEHGAPRVTMDSASNSGTVDILKNGDSSIYHYQVTRVSEAAPWKLRRSWRTDQNDHTIEEYPVP
jgi:hypothetical protein